MDLCEKIRLIRKAKVLTQSGFSKMTGIPVGTLKNYESGIRKDSQFTQLEKILTQPRFKKYTLWLMTGDINPEIGQISPEIEKQRTARAEVKSQGLAKQERDIQLPQVCCSGGNKTLSYQFGNCRLKL